MTCSKSFRFNAMLFELFLDDHGICFLILFICVRHLHARGLLHGINFTRTPIDNIVCESSCADVLSAHGYRIIKLPHWAGPDALWRREPLPPERDDGEKLDLVNAHIASSRHGLAPGAALRGLLSASG